MNSKIKIFFTLMILSMILLACSDTNKQSVKVSNGNKTEENNENTEYGNKDLIPIRIGTQPSLQIREYVAREEGLFEEAGLDPEFINFNTGVAMYPAFTKNEIDVAYYGWTGTIVGPAQDVDIKTFAVEVDVSDNEGLVVREGSGIEKLEDIKGKKIGITQGTSGHYGFLQGLKSVNLTPDDVEIINIDPPQMTPAFEKGEIDGIWVWDPWMRKLMGSGGELIATDGDVGATGHGDWVVSASYLEENQEAVQRLLKALEKANDIVLENPEIAAESMSKALEITNEQAIDIINDAEIPNAEEQFDESYHLSMNPKTVEKGEGIAESWEETSDFLLNQGIITSKPNYKNHIISNSLEKVLEN